RARAAASSVSWSHPGSGSGVRTVMGPTLQLQLALCLHTVRSSPSETSIQVMALKRSWILPSQPCRQGQPWNKPIFKCCPMCRKSWSGFILLATAMPMMLPVRCTTPWPKWQLPDPHGYCCDVAGVGCLFDGVARAYGTDDASTELVFLISVDEVVYCLLFSCGDLVATVFSGGDNNKESK